MNESKQNILGSVVNLIFRDAKIIVVVWVISIIVAVIGAMLMPKTYEAKTTILVKFGREYVYRPETGDGRAAVSQRSGMEEVINSEMQILASRDLKERVITAIGLQRLYPDLVDSELPMEQAIASFGAGLDLRSIENSNIINMYFRHTDPAIAAETLTSLVSEFRTKRLDVYRNSDVPFFEGEVGKLNNELRLAESQFLGFKSENKVYQLGDQADQLIERRNRLSGDAADSERKVSELLEKRQSLIRHLNQLPKTIVLYADSEQGKMLDEVRQKLFDLRLQEQQLLGSYREDSKPVTNIRDRIAQVSEFLANQENDVSGRSVRTGPNEVYQSFEAEQLKVETELSTMEARRDTTLRQLREIDTEVARIVSLTSRYDEMVREVDSRRRALETQLGNLSDAQAFAALDEQNKTNIRVVQSATTPTTAVGSSRKTKVLLAIPFGFLAGLLVALILNILRTTVSEPITLERKSGLQVLATMDRSD